MSTFFDKVTKVTLRNRLVSQVLTSTTFGIIAGIFSLIRFDVPGYDGGITNLGEIPILICVLYLKSPLYLIFTISIAFFLGLPSGTYFDWGIISHFLSILPVFYGYHHLLKGKNVGAVFTTVISVIGTFGYYVILVTLIALETILIEGGAGSFISIYSELWGIFIFEIVATSLSFTFFLMQHRSKNELTKHIEEIEVNIEERTRELSKAVAELNLANIELRSLNEHLDQLVLERTKELKNKNTQLSGYAFVNSHLLRAPVARIIGLSQILRQELADEKNNVLVNHLLNSCNELDEIVKLLAEYLSEEDLSNIAQLDRLKEQMTEISQAVMRRSHNE